MHAVQSLAARLVHSWAVIHMLVVSVWSLSIPTMTEVIPTVVQASLQVKLLRKGRAQHPSQHQQHMLPLITSAQNAATATSTTMFLILRP